MFGAHYACLRAVIMGAQHGCHFGNPCSRQWL